MGPVLIVEVLELPQRLKKVALIPDERAVQQFVSACLHPAFHDRVHPRHLDPAGHDLDPRVLEHGVEQAGVFAVAVPDQEPRPAAADSPVCRPTRTRRSGALSIGNARWRPTAQRSAARALRKAITCPSPMALIS